MAATTLYKLKFYSVETELIVALYNLKLWEFRIETFVLGLVELILGGG